MNDLRPFRFWCQKVLPLVYDDELSYYELLCKAVDYLNKTMENVNSLSENFDELEKTYNTLKNYVDNYFKNLDLQSEVNNKLDEMASDGTLSALINDELFKPLNHNSYTGATILCIGDSIGAGEGATTNWFKIMCNMLNATCINISQGGAGFSSGAIFNNMFNTWYNNADLKTRNSINYVFICASINDGPDILQSVNVLDYINRHINPTIDNIKNKLPNANIKLFFDGQNTCVYFGNRRIAQSKTPNIYRAMCYLQLYSEFYNCEIIQNNTKFDYNPTFPNTFFQIDSIHPTDVGQEIIAKANLSALNGITNGRENIRAVVDLTGAKANDIIKIVDRQTSSIVGIVMPTSDIIGTLKFNFNCIYDYVGTLTTSAYINIVFYDDSNIQNQNANIKISTHFMELYNTEYKSKNSYRVIIPKYYEILPIECSNKDRYISFDEITSSNLPVHFTIPNIVINRKEALDIIC